MPRFHRAVPLLLLPLLAGCNVLGVLAYKFNGPTAIPAKYVLRKKPTLVIAENFSIGTVNSQEGDQLAREVSTLLTHYELVPVIDPARLSELRSASPATFDQIPVTDLARKLGAEQVIYINLTAFKAETMPGITVYRGDAAARVRVIDVSGQLLWPIDAADGLPIAYKTDPMSADQRVTLEQVRGLTVAGLAENTVHLFRKWKPATEDSRNYE